MRVPESDSRERVKAFGFNLNLQTKILDEMSEVMLNMRVNGKSFLMPFQKGRYLIIINNFQCNLILNVFRSNYD